MILLSRPSPVPCRAVGGIVKKNMALTASSGSRKVNIAMSGYAGRFGLLVFPGLISVIPM